MDDDQIWFEPKRFGIGVGLPVRWQGWVLLAATVAAVMLAARIPQRAAMGVTEVAIIAAFLVTAARHTRGGWHWRWGGGVRRLDGATPITASTSGPPESCVAGTGGRENTGRC